MKSSQQCGTEQGLKDIPFCKQCIEKMWPARRKRRDCIVRACVEHRAKCFVIISKI